MKITDVLDGDGIYTITHDRGVSDLMVVGGKLFPFSHSDRSPLTVHDVEMARRGFYMSSSSCVTPEFESFTFTSLPAEQHP